MSSHIDVPLLNLALDYVLFPALKEVRRDALDCVRFKSDGKTLRMEATDGDHIWGSEIEAQVPMFQCLLSMEDCKAIKGICTHRFFEGWFAVGVDSSRQVVSFKVSEGEEFAFHLVDPRSSGFPSPEGAREVRIETLNPSDDLAESERHARMAKSLIKSEREAAAELMDHPGKNAVPEEFLTVVHHYGEPISQPLVRGKSTVCSWTFETAFEGWLGEKSKELVGRSSKDAASLLRSDFTQDPTAAFTKRGKRFEFQGRCEVFEYPREYEEWLTRRPKEYDGYVTGCIGEGFPIFLIMRWGD